MGIDEEMDDQAVAAQESLVVAGVVQVAGEPGEVPQKETIGAQLRIHAHVDHVEECVATYHAGRAFGHIGEDMGDDQAVMLAVAGELSFLLWDALLLGIAAAVSQVAPDRGCRGIGWLGEKYSQA